MLIGNYFNEAGGQVGDDVHFKTDDIEFAVIQVETLTDFKRALMSRHFAVLVDGNKRMVIGK